MLTCQLIGSCSHNYVKPFTYTEDNTPNHDQHNHHLARNFASYNLHCHSNRHISQDCRKSPMKGLLNTCGMCHKTHTMTTRCGSYDIEEVPATQDSSPLDLMPQEDTMPKWDNESSDKYCEETDICHSLAELLEQLQQMKDQFASLKFTTLQSTPIAELMQLIDKLQHLAMILQLHSSPNLMRNQCTKLCRHTWIPWAWHRENHTSPCPCCRISPHLTYRTHQS